MISKFCEIVFEIQQVFLENSFLFPAFWSLCQKQIMESSCECFCAYQPQQIGPYSFRCTIGEGAFSLVKLVWNEENHQYFACKVVPRERLNSPALQARFEIEIRINQQLHHPGIVKLYDLLSDEHNYYVIMEYCPNGDFFQYIVDREYLPEELARPIVRQILESLQYIHSLNITHRDLKPENLLLDASCRVKMSDFGLSRFIGNDGLVGTPCGSPCYASPECISGLPYDGKTTDVWSLGVIMFAMVTGQLPWTKRNQAELFAQIKQGQYVLPDWLSESCQSFISGLMTVDCKKRLTIEQAYHHEWLCGTPFQWPFRMPPSKVVSLRMVDKYFDKEISEVDFHLPQRPGSSRNVGMRRTSKMLRRKYGSRPKEAESRPREEAEQANPNKRRRSVKKDGLRAAARNIITQGGLRRGANTRLVLPNVQRRGLL